MEDVRPVHVCTCIAEGYMRFKPGQNSSSIESGPGSRAECCGAMCLASGQGRPARLLVDGVAQREQSLS